MRKTFVTPCLAVACLLITFSCLAHPAPVFNSSMQTISQIPLPEGFERVTISHNSFAAYLRNLPLRKDNIVYLFDHRPKINQSLHYAVIDIFIGEKDLQQCADAVMRLRAEYFFAREMYDSIRFPKDNRSFYQFSNFVRGDMTRTRENFRRFMETVFINCGTYSLQQQLKLVAHFSTIQIGGCIGQSWRTRPCGNSG